MNPIEKLLGMTNSMEVLRSVTKRAEQMADFVEKMRRDNKLIAEWYRDDICQYLAGVGWYVGGTLYGSQYKPLAVAIKAGEFAAIETFLIGHVRSRLTETIGRALAQWPDRKGILTDAFDAHKSAKYTLSIPAMLAQSDGMCAEIFGAHLFTDRHGKVNEQAADKMKQFEDRPLAHSFLSILLQDAGLRVSTDKVDLKPHKSPLNRHAVLHGIDNAYQTEANSLRAIALTDFMTWIRSIEPNRV